jgi:hypothetical protein
MNLSLNSGASCSSEHDLPSILGYQSANLLLSRVLVPEPLHGLGPGRNLLDLVQHEHRASFVGGLQPRGLPLLADPVGAAQRWLVGTDVADGNAEFTGDLLNESRLSNLTGTCDDLQESARLREPLGEHGALRAAEVCFFYSLY